MLLNNKIKVFEDYVDTLQEFNDVLPTLTNDDELNCPPSKKKKKKVFTLFFFHYLNRQCFNYLKNYLTTS